MKKKSSSFLNKVTSDAQRQKHSGSSYGYLDLPKGVKILNVEPGSTLKLDFIPYLVQNEKHPDRNDEREIATLGTLWYKRPFKIHRNVGVDKDTVVCLTSFGKKCPICDYMQKRRKEGADKEEINNLKPSLRNLYCVIPIGHKKFDEVPHVWDFSQWLFQTKLNDELEETPEYGIFPDLQEGKTLKIRFTTKTIGNSQPFPEAGRIDFFDRDHEYEESILDDVPDLDSLLHEISYKELDLKFFELDSEVIESEKEEDNDEDDTINNRKRKEIPSYSHKKVSVKVEEPEEPEEEPEEEEEEEKEEEKSRRSRPTPERTLSKKPEHEEETTRRTRSREEKKDRCPYGYKFGIDTDEYDECIKCEIWDDCIEEKEGK